MLTPFRTPFAYGMVGSAFVVGAIAGTLVLSLRGIVSLSASMAVGAAIAVLVCSWWPTQRAPAWKLWPAAVLFNPMFLIGAAYTIANYECFVGRATGWDCLLVDLGPFLCELCLIPPLFGLMLRWWRRRRLSS